MKDSIMYAALALLLVAVTATAVGAPAAYARGGDDDDDRYEDRDDRDDDDDDDDYDDDDDDDRRDRDDDDDDRDDDGLEVEAEVFTDTTVVKVERDGSRKVWFTTTADTREEVIAVVAERFNLSSSEVAAVLEFEIEDRASRANDRRGVSGVTPVKPIDRCQDDNDDMLEVEADVFTNTTIVKVELANGRTTVFETDATTTAGVVAAVADRFSSLTESEIRTALDFEVEDRASRAADFEIDDRDDCAVVDNNSNNNSGNQNNDVRIAELRAKVAELQTLLERLITLLRGSTN